MALTGLAVAEARVADLMNVVKRSDDDRDRTESRHQAELERMQEIIRELTKPAKTFLDRISAAFSK
jgi:hypothetical protein